MEPLPIEEVVRTSDDVAVRRKFDSRNLVYMTMLLLFFTVGALFQFGDAVDDDDRPAIASVVANFTLNVILLMVVRDAFRIRKGITPKGIAGPAQFVLRHVSATLITYIAVQYGFVMFSSRTGGWEGWATSLPFMLAGVRMTVAELVLLHGYLFSVVPVMVFVTESARNRLPMLVSSAIINATVLGFELWASRRMRREVIADWSERRLQAREQLRMRDELQYARELQLAMLPEHAPRLEWVDLAGMSVPATEVGGDYYDYFVDGNRVAIVCGDVAGHGLVSGLVLVSLRSGFTLLRDALANPAHVLGRLHDLIAHTSRRRVLATVAVVLLDREAGRATIASAGHPPVIVRRGDRIDAVELFAPPLGVRLPVDIPQVTLDVAPGDLVVLHSDGVYESRNADEETYGLDRLAAVVLAHPVDAPAELLRDAIARDVERFRGGAAQDDDVTIVVARITS